jgi:hypothetical protein
MKTLIKNGTLITASDTYNADILIEDEKITQIGQALHVPGRRACGRFEQAYPARRCGRAHPLRPGDVRHGLVR